MYSVNILFVIGSTEVGGAEKQLLELSSALVQKKHQVSVFVIGPSGPLTQKFKGAGVHVYENKIYRWILAKRLNLKFFFFAAQVFACLNYVAICFWRRPNIIHYILPHAYLFGCALSFFCPRSILVMSRRSLNTYQAGRPRLRHLEQLFFRRLSGIITNSEAAYGQLVEEGARPDSIRLIYNGVELDKFEITDEQRCSIRNNLSIPEDSALIVVLANLKFYKGFDDLIDALGILDEASNLPWHCLILGRDDGEGDEINEKIRFKRLSKKVKLIGQRSDVEKILVAANIGLLCSHEEGLPNAVLEYLSAGLFVVATAVGGTPEIGIDKAHGQLVPPRNPEAIASATLIALKKTHLGIRPVGAKNIVRAKFKMSDMVENHCEFYNELYNSKRNIAK